MDLDVSKICFGYFDERYVLFFRVRIGWSIWGFSLFLVCIWVEWWEVECVVVDVLSGLKGDLVGCYYRFSEMIEVE